MASEMRCGECGWAFQVSGAERGSSLFCPRCSSAIPPEVDPPADRDVFISYSSRDHEVVKATVRALESANLRTWVAPRDILPGADWASAIIDGINRCQALVLIFSRHSNSSGHVLREIERATAKGLPIVPFRIERTPLSRALEFFISSSHWLDADDGTWANHLDLLARAARAAVNQYRAASAPRQAPASHQRGESGTSRGPRAGVLTTIGIDLGTTNSVVAVMEEGRPRVIHNATGQSQTPSVVAFSSQRGVIVGREARDQQVFDPMNTIGSVKRFMGRRQRDIAPDAKAVGYEITGTGDQYLSIKANGEQYTPEEISAHILRDLKETAERYLQAPVNGAIVAVPAYFTDLQRTAVRRAGELAGLRILRLLPEPTAAALAFGFHDHDHAAQKLCVLDLGGGTFDVSVLDAGDGVYEVLATRGDTQLGGDNFDQLLANHVAELCRSSHGVDPRENVMTLRYLQEAAEKAKIELSSSTHAQLHIPLLNTAPERLATSMGYFRLEVTRAQFEQLIVSQIERCRSHAVDAIGDARLGVDQISEVILVGGSTRIPLFQQMVRALFGGKLPNRSVNPDEAVALGCAIQAGIATGSVLSKLVIDAIPLSIGFETLGGVMQILVPRNSSIPSQQKETVTTVTDQQTAVTLHIYQGEREFTCDNVYLGSCSIAGLLPAPRGLPRVDVILEVDVNGQLTVSLKDVATGREARTSLLASTANWKEATTRRADSSSAEAVLVPTEDNASDPAPD